MGILKMEGAWAGPRWAQQERFQDGKRMGSLKMETAWAGPGWARQNAAQLCIGHAETGPR